MRHTILLALIATLALLLAPAAQADPPPFAQFASGVVFHDQNGNGTRDEGEPGIADVRVSNQLQVTTTDAEGRWRLPVSPDTRIFVVKPRNWRTPVSAENLPRFHYNYKPQGSPTSKFGGVAATGDLPDEIDFALVPHAEPDRFSAIFFADTQPYTIEQVDYVAHDVVEPLIADHHEARFGVTLGDIVGDDLNLYGPLNRAIGRIGIPWYNVFGNHDANYDVTRDEDSDETFERVFAPNYYSWDCGKVHFIATDGVDQNGRRYIGHLGERQLKWIENDLAHVPDDMLVVLLMHIPLLTDGRGASVNVDDRHALYRLIEHRTHVLALAGHMHRHDHRFIGEEDDWHGKQPLEQVYIVTVSGNWWSGEKDARGIPDARMSDGGPNGYMLAMFDGASHKLQYRAASRPADYQMDIHAPHAVFTDRLAQTAVFVNVFDGSPRSVVEMQINAGEWKAIPQVRRGGAELQRLLADLGQPPYDTSTHLWRTTLPVDTPPGSAAIRIRTT
ncbi:MAG: calcineurin-like phosphoesterase C-terminal domain-containing protein, partial [Planctomycetota bacterium]